MTSRQRFQETMWNGHPDRVPFLDEGIRDDVYKKWRVSSQELKSELNIDDHKFLMPNIDPLPEPRRWPQNIKDLYSFQNYIDPENPERFGAEWQREIDHCNTNDTIRILRAHRGFFLTMGVNDWNRFEHVVNLLLEETKFVGKYLQQYNEFIARIMQKALTQIDIDAVYFSEPIGGKNASLIAPQMYRDIILRSYRPVLEIIRESGIKTIIFLSYSNVRNLIPMLIDAGFNCLWACETDHPDMDYNSIRNEFGRDLNLIGGIDLNLLSKKQVEIKKELTEKVLPLLLEGGYIPLMNGRVREHISLKKYMNYRRILSNIINEMNS